VWTATCPQFWNKRSSFLLIFIVVVFVDDDAAAYDDLNLPVLSFIEGSAYGFNRINGEVS